MRALQSGQAVAGLFEAGAEDLPQLVDIVPQIAGACAEPFVGHQQRACRIVAEPHGQQLTRGDRLQRGIIDQPCDLIA